MNYIVDVCIIKELATKVWCRVDITIEQTEVDLTAGLYVDAEPATGMVTDEAIKSKVINSIAPFFCACSGIGFTVNVKRSVETDFEAGQ